MKKYLPLWLLSLLLTATTLPVQAEVTSGRTIKTELQPKVAGTKPARSARDIAAPPMSQPEQPAA